MRVQLYFFHFVFVLALACFTSSFVLPLYVVEVIFDPLGRSVTARDRLCGCR